RIVRNPSIEHAPAAADRRPRRAVEGRRDHGVAGLVVEADAVPVFPALDQYRARVARLDDQGAAGKNLGSGYRPAGDLVVRRDLDAGAGLDEEADQVGG